MAEPVNHNASVIGTDLEAANDEKETSTPQVVATSEKSAEDKPQASEEIMIEEISIDGMCGVY